MGLKLTKSVIDRTSYQGDGKSRYLLWDSDIRGLALRVFPSGQKSFVLYYRTNGRQRLMTIGPYGVLTIDQARIKARKLLIEVLDGHDPLRDRETAKDAHTVESLCASYMNKYAIGPNPEKPHKKSYLEDQRRIDKYILPAWRHHKVVSIQHSDALELRHRIGERSIYEANRTMALISVMWEFAKAEGTIERTADNPARGIEKYKENKRTRWITPEEMPKLLQAINSHPHIYARAAFLIFLFTGCRKSEILGAKWEYLDFERKVLNLPDTKSGQPHHVPLSSAAIEVLKQVPRMEDNPYIFPGRVHGHPLKGSFKIWDEIRHAAGIPDVRIHDLRHTLGSWLKQAGNDSFIIQKVLGHSDARTTQRYMHLAQEHLRAPLEKHGNAILELAQKGT